MNNYQPPTFEDFSKQVDDEMKVFAKYLMNRALVSGIDGLNITRYMAILASLSRGTSLLHFVLEEEGLTKKDIEIAMLAMKESDNEIRNDFEEFKQEKKRSEVGG